MSKRTVLFVDDEVNVLNSLKRGLIGEEYDCEFVSSAKEALKILEKQDISVIVTDMRMPEMDGLTLLKIMNDILTNDKKNFITIALTFILNRLLEIDSRYNVKFTSTSKESTNGVGIKILYRG